MNCKLYLILILVGLFNIAYSIETKVELVQILFRHGARTPVKSYPKDIYHEDAWRKFGGYGQLTQTGMRQHFDYGKFLRDRYSQFLNNTYDRHRVQIRSTDYDRTLMSAYSLLAGLFEPVDFQKWNKDLNWQPIPVHTTELKNDKIFYSNACPKLNDLRAQVRQTPEYIEMNKKFDDLFKVLDENSGYTDVSIDTIWTVADVLFIEKLNNLTLPDWAEQNYDRIMSSSGLGFYFDFRWPEIAKLVSGGILKSMRQNIIDKIKHESSSQNQLYLFSGHDTYVAGLMKLLDINNHINQPPFASSITIELRKSIDNSTASTSRKNSKDNLDQYYVKIYYKNNTLDEDIYMREMSMNGCHTLCPLKTFMELTEKWAVEDFGKECKLSKDGEYDKFVKQILYYFFGTLSFVVLLMVICVIFFMAKQSNQVIERKIFSQKPFSQSYTSI